MIGKYHREFDGQEQQDAQEFLVFLLDGLHEDLNQPDLRPRPDLDALMEDDTFEALDDVVSPPYPPPFSFSRLATFSRRDIGTI